MFCVMNMDNIFHISDCKKYNRCERLYRLDKENEPEKFRPFVRLDEEVTELAAKKLGIKDCFKGQRGDDPSLAMDALDQYDWLVKARFQYDRLRIKVPFLHRTENGWDLYFLFVGLYPHADDIQFYCDMVFVLEGCGIKLNEIRIIHLNADYVREGKLDTDRLFVISDALYNMSNHPTIPLKETIEQKKRDIRPLLKEMAECENRPFPSPKRSQKCTGRMKCRYYQNCFEENEEMPDNSILTLNASREKYNMAKEGVRFLKDADVERLEGNRQQYAEIMADKNGGLFVDKAALTAWLSRITYPVSFLDFEWERFAIPPYDGMKPYDVMPFEYSLHILHEDGRVDHNVFLSVHDDRKELAESLIQHVPAEGSVIAYNAFTAEKVRIEELGEQFPMYKEQLDAINARMEDLELIFVSGIVYDVRMAGQWSLKKVMAMMDDESYNDLAIHQGMEAVFEWRHLDNNESEDREEIIENLKKYCSMDTYAMLVIYNWLRKMTNG